MRRLAVACVMVAGLTFNAGSAWAHDNAPTAPAPDASPELTRGIESLTTRLLDLQGQLQRASDSEGKKRALQHLISTAAARQQRLAALIEEHPGAVIKAALAPRVRAALPAEVQRYLEEDVTLEGEVDVLHEDYADSGRYVHWLKTGGSRLAMHFAKRMPQLQTGDRVRVRGLRVVQALAVGGGGQLSVMSAAVSSNTLGPQKTAVILIAFSNAPGVASTTAAQATEVVFTGSQSVSNFFYESSYQQTTLTGNVFGPYTIPISGVGSACDYFGIATAAEQAATSAGVNLSSYTRRVYAFPSNGCAWWGLGTVGGYPSMAWINGSFQNGVVAHEMGHNLGLYHSHALECGAATIAASCSSVEYGDVLDTMGSATPPKHYNAAQKERLGWLGYNASPPITTVQQSGVYTIDPYETPGSTPKAIKVRSTTGDWYYVEYRQALGFDASAITSNPNVKNGVVVHLMDGGDANGIYLLDMTPATSSWSDPALGVGQTFVDAAGGISITPEWANGTNAGVSVTIGPSACVRRNPSIAVSPAQQQGPAGATLTYTISVTNNDSGCATSAFMQNATVPSGFSLAFGTGALSINAGATVSTTMSVKSPTNVAAGSYAIAPRVSNANDPVYAGAASASYVVPSACERRNPSVVVTPAQQQGKAGATLSYSVSVTNNDSGCGTSNFSQSASVPSGWSASYSAASLSLASGASGKTTLSVKSPNAVDSGTFNVIPRATNSAATSYVGSATATYEVPAVCVRKAPTVTVSPAQQQGAPNVPVTYTVSVTNNDVGCTSSSFSQNVKAPSGWTTAYSGAALSANPGATVTTTLSVKPPANAKAGNYTITPKATNTAATSFVTTTSATYTVVAGGGNGDNGGGTGPVASFSDNFNRANSDDLGNGWVTGAGDFSIVDGELRSGPVRSLHMAVLPDVSGANASASASFASADNNYSPRFGLIVRYRDARNYYMCYRITGGVSALRISKVVNGFELVLKQVSVGNPAKDTMFKLACGADGHTISLEMGTTRLSVSDSTFNDGAVGVVMGSVWLLGGKAPQHRADDFAASVQ